MRKSPPKTVHWFRHVWDELHYRCLKATFQLYCRHSTAGAKRHVNRIRQILDLPSVRNNNVAIIGQVARALVAEYDGDWRRGLHYRKREVTATTRSYAALLPNDPNTREYALMDRHKFEVLRTLIAAKRLYSRHASAATVAAFQANIDRMKEVEEPDNPGKTRGSRKAEQATSSWSNKAFFDLKHAEEVTASPTIVRRLEARLARRNTARTR